MKSAEPRTKIILLAALVILPAFLTDLHAEQERETPVKSAFVRDGTLHIEVEGHKPLFWAIHELERMCVCAITYEDARLENRADMVELSPGLKEGRRGLMPRGGSLSLAIPVASPDLKESIDSVLLAVIDGYDRQQLPGRFKIEKDGDVRHIVPAQVRSAAGAFIATDSVMDTVVTIEPGDRSALETVQLALADATRRTGVAIELASSPTNIMIRQRVRTDAKPETLRQLLTRVVAAFPVQTSWGVGYDISLQRYFVALHQIRRPR